MKNNYQIHIIIAAASTVVINLFMLLVMNIPFDWYILPVSMCGILSVYQILKIWDITRKLDLRLPMVFYFYCTIWFGCYLAPLMHFALNFWLIFIRSESDLAFVLQLPRGKCAYP